jgi:hypothetical protein
MHSFSAFIRLQFEVNIGSSMVANGIMGMVVGYITNLVVDMAFLVQVKEPFVSFLCLKSVCLWKFSNSKAKHWVRKSYLVRFCLSTCAPIFGKHTTHLKYPISAFLVRDHSKKKWFFFRRSFVQSNELAPRKKVSDPLLTC